MDIQQAKDLLQRYRAGKCTPAENELVEKWYEQLAESGEWQWNTGEKEAMQDLIGARVMRQLNGSRNKRIIYLKPQALWWAAAASIIILIGTFSYFQLVHKRVAPVQVAKVRANDIKAPQSSRAMITLSNGQSVYLDSVGNGVVAVQGNVRLVKLANGKIAYEAGAGEAEGRMQFNTLTNPRGSKVINMTLPDGSEVWLNAASSITFPTAFTGKEREVTITGEAYFEVAHNAKQPFHVKVNAMNIEVLGTHFNVNSYTDESFIKTTLLEGSVKISKNNGETVLLKPRQQALVNQSTAQPITITMPDIDQVMAWKNGKFFYNNTDLKTIMRQIMRWYDVDVEYKDNIPVRYFTADISRDKNLSDILKILELSNIHFRLEEDSSPGHAGKITVLP